MKKRNLAIDISKFVFAFMVVCWHYTTPFHDTVAIFVKLSVSGFFLLSGYFLGLKKDKTLVNTGDSNLTPSFEIQKNYILSCLKYLLSGIFLYILIYTIFLNLPVQSLVDDYLFASFQNFPRDFLFKNIVPLGGHMWFLAALVVISIIHYFCCRFNKTKYYAYAAAVLLVCGLCLQTFNQQLQVHTFTYRNAIFLGFPLFAIGYLFAIKDVKKVISSRRLYKFGTLALGLLFAGLQYVEHITFNSNVTDFYICSIISAIFIVLFLISTKTTYAAKLVDVQLPFNIYLTHIGIADILSHNNIKLGQYKAFVVFAIAFIICEAYYLLKIAIKILLKKFKSYYQCKKSLT